MKELNQQQIDYIRFRLEGFDHIQSVRKAYPKLTQGSVYVIGCRLKKNPQIQERLKQGEREMRGKIINKQSRFIDILRDLCPPIEVAKRLAELIFSNDSRIADSAIEKYLRLSSEYPSEKLNVLVQASRERAEVLSETDIKQLENRAAKEREQITTIEHKDIEEAETKDPAKKPKQS